LSCIWRGLRGSFPPLAVVGRYRMQPSVHRYNFSPFFGGHTDTTQTYPCPLALGSSGSRSFSTCKVHDRCIFFIRSIASLRVLNVSTCKCFRPFPSLGITAVLVNHSVTFAPYFLCSRAMKAGVGHSYLVLDPTADCDGDQAHLAQTESDGSFEINDVADGSYALKNGV